MDVTGGLTEVWLSMLFLFGRDFLEARRKTR